jgi:G patch domain and KOW motifs-containing protein
MPDSTTTAADTIDPKDINKFETAAHDTAIAQHDVSYGLQVRNRPEISNGHHHPPPPPPPQDEAAQLKEDLASLPPEATLEAYEAMPVESFGEALLRGMGWVEGKAIGRMHREEVEAIELLRRPTRLGLGAAPVPETNEKKIIKPGESRKQADMVYVDEKGRVLNSKPVGKAAVERGEASHADSDVAVAGKTMHIVQGRHAGLKCEVVGLEPEEEGRSQRARVRMLPSYETVIVNCKDLADNNIDSRKRSQEEVNLDHNNDDDKRKKKKGRERERERDISGSDEEEEEKETGGGAAWLVPHVKVKIIDKKLKHGKYYLKKGCIIDVKAPTLCDVLLDEKDHVVEVHQSQLETVVPKKEGTVLLVVAGEKRGERGKLLSRNSETGLAAVQLLGDFSIHKLSLDDVAEYVGFGYN